jgi:hypothetical protein
MIHVKYVLPHHRIRREESRENEAMKTQKLLHSSRPRINARMRTMCGSKTGGWSLPCVMSD